MEQITLYKNFIKKKNSTKRPTDGFTLNVAMKNDTSYESPVFVIDGIDLDYNYAKWRDHYYFIDDITVINNRVCELSCSQDVLATYKDYIAEYNAYVERSNTSHSLYLDDNRMVSTSQIIKEDYAETSIPMFDTTKSGCYVLRTLGKKNIKGYAIAYDGLDYVLEQIAALTSTTLANPFQYIISVKWFPMSLQTIKSGDEQVDISLGNNTIPKDKVFAYDILDTFQSDEITVNIPQPTYTDYRAYNPSFTRYSMYIPGASIMDISPSDIRGGDLKLSYCADLVTGELKCRLYKTNGITISYTLGKVGVDVQIAQAVTSLSTLLNGAVGVASSVATGNVLGVASSVGGLISSYANPTPSIVGAVGSIQSLKTWNKIKVCLTNYGSTPYSAELFGRPLGEIKRLGDLNGYIQCVNASIDLPSLGGDRDAVNGYLNGGFYYE